MTKKYSIKQNHNIRTSMVRNKTTMTTKIEIDIDVTIEDDTFDASVALVQDEKNTDQWHLQGIMMIEEKDFSEEFNEPEDLKSIKKQIGTELAAIIKKSRTKSLSWAMPAIKSQNPYVI